MISQVGIILYMFLVGLELDPALLRTRMHTTIAISLASMTVPFLSGTALALLLYPRLCSGDVRFTNCALFLGVSMSVTAFPVLARILTDQEIHETAIGVTALTCASIDDITAWCLLAFVVSVAKNEASSSIRPVAFVIGYVAAIVLLVQPTMTQLSRLYGNRGRMTQGMLTVVFVSLLLSAAATDLIGIHAVFGAFALGVIMPPNTGMTRELSNKLEDVVIVPLNGSVQNFSVVQHHRNRRPRLHLLHVVEILRRGSLWCAWPCAAAAQTLAEPGCGPRIG